MLVGAHVTVAGGLGNGPAHGRLIGATAIQIFTRNQRQWRSLPIADREAAEFRAALRRSGVRRVVSHASYLINIASPDGRVLSMGRGALTAEVERCARLGVGAVILHPGAHMHQGVPAGIARAAESLALALELTAGCAVRILVEGTAGQGTSIGSTFEQLAQILARAGGGPRLGICLDTCHLVAAGYDLMTPAGYRETWKAFDRIVGRAQLQALHLNDSLKGLGSHVDRHAPLLEGVLGRATIQRLASDPRFRRIPLILETPGPLPIWKREITLLRRLAAQRPPLSGLKSSGATRARRRPRTERPEPQAGSRAPASPR